MGELQCPTLTFAIERITNYPRKFLYPAKVEVRLHCMKDYFFQATHAKGGEYVIESIKLFQVKDDVKEAQFSIIDGNKTVGSAVLNLLQYMNGELHKIDIPIINQCILQILFQFSPSTQCKNIENHVEFIASA